MLQPWGRVEEEREKERRGKGEGLRDKECLVMLSGLLIPLQLPPPPSYSNSQNGCRHRVGKGEGAVRHI